MDRRNGRPKAIVAATVKGRVSAWHGEQQRLALHAADPERDLRRRVGGRLKAGESDLLAHPHGKPRSMTSGFCC